MSTPRGSSGAATAGNDDTAPVVMVLGSAAMLTAAQVHDPQQGRVVLVGWPAPRKTRAKEEVHDALRRSLGAADIAARNAGDAATRLMARLRAQRITDVFLIEAHRCGSADVEHLINLGMATSTRIWLLTTSENHDASGTPPVIESAHQWVNPAQDWTSDAFTAHWQARLDEEARQPAAAAADITSSLDGGAAAGAAGHAPAQDEPAELPDADVFSFLTSCDELLSAREAAWVRATVAQEVSSASTWLATLDPPLRVQPANGNLKPAPQTAALNAAVSQQVADYLLERYLQAPTQTRLTCTLRATQLALFRAGILLQVADRQLLSHARRHPGR